MTHFKTLIATGIALSAIFAMTACGSADNASSTTTSTTTTVDSAANASPDATTTTSSASATSSTDSDGRMWSIASDGTVTIKLATSDKGGTATFKVPATSPGFSKPPAAELSAGDSNVVVNEGPGMADLHVHLSVGNEAKMLKARDATKAGAATFCGSSGKRLDDDGGGNAYASIALPNDASRSVIFWANGGSAGDRKAVLDSICVK